MCMTVRDMTGSDNEGAFGEGDSGKTAQMISNASFATLSLIYSFTEVLDLSDQLSTLAGLTVRVGQLRQVRHIYLLWQGAKFSAVSNALEQVLACNRDMQALSLSGNSWPSRDHEDEGMENMHLQPGASWTNSPAVLEVALEARFRLQ